MVLLMEHLRQSRYARPFLGTGVIGAYTTFSTYVVEADLLVRDRHSNTAAAYALASLACGLLAVWAGITLGRLIARPQQANQHAELAGSVADGMPQHDSNSDALR